MNKSVFTKDPGSRKLQVVREFDAGLTAVWDAWTRSELLDQWWAPRPWKAETKTMDFKPGGYWLYCMQGPEGEKHYSRSDFQTIAPQQNFTATTGFCDENGVLNLDFSGSEWNCQFAPTATGTTEVTVQITYTSAENMQKMLDMGFEQGFSMGHANLDELLAKQK